MEGKNLERDLSFLPGPGKKRSLVPELQVYFLEIFKLNKTKNSKILEKFANPI
jgi:hypothetical protein